MARIAHLSDLHAGYKAYRHVDDRGVNLREVDGYVALRALITDVIEAGVDAVVIAGDTFHSPTPSMRTIITVQDEFRRLWEAGISVYTLAGNHDTNDIREDIAASRVLHDPWRNIYSHVEPYVQHEIANGLMLHMISHHMYGDQATTMDKVASVDGAVNLLTTHGSVIDPLLQIRLKTEQSPREVVIPDSLLAEHNWDAMLLGHIHERGWVGATENSTLSTGANGELERGLLPAEVSDEAGDANSEAPGESSLASKMLYNGSLIRRGFSDKMTPLGRGWTLWEIDSDGSFTTEFHQVAQRPQIDFSTINASKFTASEITEQIVENLRASRVGGSGEFIAETAPILRQSLVGITPAKRQSIDWARIDHEAQHAMEWSVKTATITPTENEVDNGTQSPLEAASSGDIVSVYDSWMDQSKVLADTRTDIRELVAEQARAFVRQGQEEVLESE